MDLQIEAGAEIWVLGRDEDGTACDISGCMFLAETGGFVIVSPYINGMEHFEDIMAHHVRETAENYDTALAVFPAKDCFMTEEEVLSAWKEEVPNE